MASILSEKIREERANAALNGMVDGQPPLIPDWCLQLVVFVLAFATVVSRRPDAVFNAQFWAEDGKFWYADAYNTGGIGPFLWPYFGYLHFVPRLTALIAHALPLGRGPLLFNLVAIVIEILPVQLLVSSRLSGLGSVSTRMLLGFLCLSLPHTWEIHSNITNAQWHLALLEAARQRVMTERELCLRAQAPEHFVGQPEGAQCRCSAPQTRFGGHRDVGTVPIGALVRLDRAKSAATYRMPERFNRGFWE